MKKTIFTLLLVLVVQIINAQTLELNSNGYSSKFKKIDTLFYNKYFGSKPVSKDVNIINTVQANDNGFSIITRSITETNNLTEKFAGSKKLLTTSFYEYSDGTLQAPTELLFFKPAKISTVLTDFKQFGKVTKHNIFKGYYYLQVNTSIYNTGDKIMGLCNSLYSDRKVVIIEPIFIKLMKPTNPLLPNHGILPILVYLEVLQVLI